MVKHSMVIANIPTGYADGYSCLLSNKGWVLVNGEKAPIVGNIYMDQMMVDVTGILMLLSELKWYLWARVKTKALLLMT